VETVMRGPQARLEGSGPVRRSGITISSRLQMVGGHRYGSLKLSFR